MNLRAALVGVASSLISGALVAAPRHALQIGLDAGAQSVRDDVLVPLAHSGFRLALSPRYAADLSPVLLLADARLAASYVLGRFDEEGLTFGWSVHTSSQFLLSEGACGGVSLGPALGWDNETFFFGDWDDAHTYWIGALWIGPRAHVWRWLGRSFRLDFDAQLGLAGLLSRPPEYRLRKQETSENIPRFWGWPTRSLAPAWILDFQVARVAADLYHTKSRARVPTGFGVGSELALLRAADPAPAFAVELVFRASYTFGL